MTLKGSVCGWVYGLMDYYQMFDLTEKDLTKSILDFPGGISSFNAELFKQGKIIVSGDVSYELPIDDMSWQADNVFAKNKELFEQYAAKGGVECESSLIAIFNQWLLSKQLFLADYPLGVEQNRYRSFTMPALPFSDDEFELVLCSDFLAVTESASGVTSMQLIEELCRVGEEVRLYPLMDSSGEMNSALGPVMVQLQQNNFGVEVREIAFEQQVGGNAMLRIWSKECLV